MTHKMYVVHPVLKSKQKYNDHSPQVHADKKE